MKNGLIIQTSLFSKRRHSLVNKQSQYTSHIAQYQKKKGSQTIKFDQLIKYNMRNTFVEKSYTKSGGKTILRPFSKKSKLSISLYQ